VRNALFGFLCASHRKELDGWSDDAVPKFRWRGTIDRGSAWTVRRVAPRHAVTSHLSHQNVVHKFTEDCCLILPFVPPSCDDPP
jgi:hypothetical protein